MAGFQPITYGRFWVFTEGGEAAAIAAPRARPRATWIMSLTGNTSIPSRRRLEKRGGVAAATP